jgi:protein NrfD
MNDVELTMIRTNPGVDPNLAVWQWEIPLYLFLGGLVAGLMVIGAVQQLRGDEKRWESRLSLWSSGLGAAFLSVGMLALLLDLAHKAYVPRFYLAFKPSSPMSWGAWILILAYPALGLWFLRSLSDDQWKGLVARFGPIRLAGAFRNWAQDKGKFVLWSNVVVGVGLGTYTGILLQTLVARPLWNTGLFGPLFLASGVSGAAALLMLLRPGQALLGDLLKWDLVALALEGLLIFLFLMEKATGPAVDRLSVGLLLDGPFTGAFFGVVLVGGILVPMVMEVAELRHNTRVAGWAAPLLVLAGGLGLRAVLVGAGQMSNYSMLLGG